MDLLADWSRTPIVLNNQNSITIKFRATATHNPSFWNFYLTKDGFDPTQK